MRGNYSDQIVQSHPWDSIFSHFNGYKPASADFIDWLRNSKYAFGLFAVTSMDEVVIGQSPQFSLHRNVIRVHEIGDNFRITFVESETSSSERQFRQTELIPAFERLLESLHWFAE
jgi:hypothetical protein